MKDIPKMPAEYKGKIKKSGGYTNTPPREWTTPEIEWVKKLLIEGFTNTEIAESIDRSIVATSIKIKRLSKANSTYNNKHVEDKNKTNIEFIQYLKPETLYDVFAGEKSLYNGLVDKVVTNDKNKQYNTDYHLDALKFLCKEYCENKKVDVIDLDPFGSAYECFDLAIKIAQKGLVVTFGELGHKRWKRLDFVSRYYGINNLDDFTLDNLIEHVKVIGLRNKKELRVYSKREWRNIGRVWFEILPIKITEQWEKKT